MTSLAFNGAVGTPPIRFRRRCAAVLAAAFALVFLVALPARAEDGWWSGLDEGEAVSLADVMRGPESYRDRTITFFAVFHTASGEFKYYPPGTLFTEARYANFSAWADGTPMWVDETTWRQDLPFLYLPRSHVQRTELSSLAPFTRLEITGRIRHIVRGQPAIEVFSFREAGHRLGKPVVDNIKWGLNYTRSGTREGLQSAARRFKLALQPDLPPVYAIILRKYLADTLRRLGHAEEADRYERGETVGTPELPDSLPPPDDQPDPFPDEDFPAPAPGGAPQQPSPDGPAPSGFGTPDGSSDLPVPPGMPEGFDAPTAPRATPGAPPAVPGPGPATTPGDGARRASGIPPPRRPRLNGVK